MKRQLHQFLLWTTGIAVLLVSGVSVVLSKNESRELTAKLQLLNEQEEQLASEWGQLQLEESTLANHERVGNAADRLGLEEPDKQEIVVLKP